jgi:glycosyltransferase involved in cell wall biosynthesis
MIHAAAALQPLVSVIVPVFDRAGCLGRALASALAQGYRPLELVVIDDGSTDATASVIDEWRALAAHAEHGAVNFVGLHQDNLGVSAARNAGIRAAHGEWIALLDSDDEWRPEKLARQMAHFAEHPGLRIGQTGEIWIRRGQRVNAPERLRKAAGDLFAASLDHCAISPSAAVMRRDLLDEVGLFDESYPACEDYELWLRIACWHAVGLLDEPLLVKYGGHEDQLSTTVIALDRFRIRAIAKTLDSGILTAEQRGLAIAELGRKARIYAAGLAKRGRESEAEEVRSLAQRFGVGWIS